MSGKTVLIYTEQGFGDSIQFIRYAAPLRARGARVVLLCEPELERLLRAATGVDRAVSSEPLAAYDLHAPLHSLPFLLRTRSFRPTKTPYVRVDRQLRAAWQQFTASAAGIKVGLVWSGRTRNERELRRSIAPELLDGFSSIKGVTLYSLQREFDRVPRGVLPVGDKLSDFADTAAFLASLDLVISADTAVAHVAGALGKPVWLLLPKLPNWRWGLSGDETPWYPSMRLFRQERTSEWPSVIDRVGQELMRALGVRGPRARRGIST